MKLRKFILAAVTPTMVPGLAIVTSCNNGQNDPHIVQPTQEQKKKEPGKGVKSATYSIQLKETVTKDQLSVSITDESVSANGGTLTVSSYNVSGSNCNVEVGWASTPSTTQTCSFTIVLSTSGWTSRVAGCSIKYTPEDTPPIIHVTGVSLNKSAISINMGDSATLLANITPYNATDQSVTWKSSNTSVATVNSGGTISTVGVGTATITVTTNDGGYSATCIVTVKPIAVTSVSLNKHSLEIKTKSGQSLTATVAPEKATDKSIKWESSDQSVATVSQDGVVSAVSIGTATIKASSVSNPEIYDTCSVNIIPSEVIITLTELGDNIQLLKDYVVEFWQNPTDSNPILNEYKGVAENSRPNSIPLTWSVEERVSNADPFKITVSEHPDLSEPFIVVDNATSGYELWNCKINTRYYWQVTKGEFKSNISSFKSQECKGRMLYISGVTNCRDLGGYTTSQNKKIKQGVLFRTGRYNESNTDTFKKEITEKGENQYKNQLGITHELDIRLDNWERGGLGDESCIEGVGYDWYAMNWNNDILENNKVQIGNIFNNVFSKEENYPLSFHCNIGTDRTGCLAYTLLALCGVAKEDLVGDYLLSNFGNIGGSRRFSGISGGYPTTYDNAEGESLMDKTANVLMSKCNVTAENINKIRNILIED